MKLLSLIFLAFCVTLQAGDLKFEKDLYEAHAGLKDELVTSEFNFTNASDRTVKIRLADAGCSCVAVELLNGKTTYAAGESGIMRLTYKIESTQGIINKTVSIWLEGDPDEKPSSQVVFRIHIPTAITLEPKTLNWDIDSKPEAKFIRIKIDYDKPVRVIKVSLSSENFTTEIVTVEDGKSYDVKVTPKSTADPGICLIGIESDIDLQKYRAQQGFARVSRPTTKP
jgi:hypothetical protein